jgi:hypothetical protein
MSTITLIFGETSAPHCDGFGFYVEEGSIFDADDFASAYNLNVHDIDPQHIKSAQDASARLSPGTWLHVDFETAKA